jgi:hypothetical protein
MAKKQPIIKETAVAASSARAAKPKTPRVTAAKHSKAVSTESISIEATLVESTLIEAVAVPASSENAEEIIARIAHGYWEARGCQGGSAHEDWIRAEQEYRQQVSR